MNKILLVIALTVLAVLAVAVYGAFYVNKNHYSIWNANKVSIMAVPPLQVEKVKVYFGVSVNTINREDDTDLFDNMQKYTVLFDKKNKHVIPNEYGENDFLVTYNNAYYLSFRQFKTNRNNRHNYTFSVVEREGNPTLQVQIEGQNSMNFERSMIPIANADEYRCNVPKEKAGSMYNMVELSGK